MADSTPTARALPLGCRRIFFFSSRRRHTRSDRDWSSDVCFFRSLVEAAASRPGVVGIDLAGGPSAAHAHGLASYAPAFRRAEALGLGRTVHAGEGRPPAEIREVGRASCRERVEISVVAGSLKKKK